MEKVFGVVKEDDHMDLPPGFRFHPTDEELITHYLHEKVFDVSFSARAIGDVDLNKNEPWELPWKAKMGEKEWYFFCMRDRKYPTGLRTNRATVSGYWKATGKDKEIYKGKTLIGMKKTLVFYKGRAPKGEKTNWVMHEYRLEGIFSVHNLPKTAKNEWVICRVFQKGCDGKKTHISGLVGLGSSLVINYSGISLPPLMDSSSPDNCKKFRKNTFADLAYVPCFSNPIIDCFNNNNKNPVISNSSSSCPDVHVFPLSSSFYSPLSSAPDPASSNNQFPASASASASAPVFMQDHSILRASIENHGSNMTSQSFRTEREMISVSQDTCLTVKAAINPEISLVVSDLDLVKRAPYDHDHHQDQDAPSTSALPVTVDLDFFWNI